MSWEVKSLDSLCDEITVGFVGSMASEYKSDGITFLRSLNIEPFKLNLNPNQLKFISEDFHSKIKKSKLNGGDLAIVRTGLPGTCCVIPNDFGEVNCSDLVIARPKKNINPFYLCYFINSPLGMGSIGGSLVGVAQKHFNVSVAKRMQIPIPNLITQNRIASILSAYDNLIENNLKRIKLLEETAQNVYKEWFVNFRFPNYEHTEFDKESGLPVGWTKLVLNDVADVLSSKRVFLSDYVESGIPFYRGKEITQKSNFTNISELYYITQEKFLELEAKSGSPKEGEILITGVGTIGNSYLVNEFDEKFYFKDGNLLWIRNIDNKISAEYMIQYFKSSDFKGIVDSISIGSSQKALTINSLKSIKILIPEQYLINNYTSKTKVILKQINTLYEELKILKEARDILLPRLMNRTIEV